MYNIKFTQMQHRSYNRTFHTTMCSIQFQLKSLQKREKVRVTQERLMNEVTYKKQSLIYMAFTLISMSIKGQDVSCSWNYFRKATQPYNWVSNKPRRKLIKQYFRIFLYIFLFLSRLSDYFASLKAIKIEHLHNMHY